MQITYFIILFFMYSTFALSSTQKMGGNVSLSGEIIESACTIATDDVWQEISFGTMPLTEIYNENASLNKPFHIHLVNCLLDRSDGGVWNSADVTFDGVLHDGFEDMFAMTGEGKGIGVNITDEFGNKALPGQSLPEVKLHGNTNDLKFNVRLTRNNDALKSGDLSSFVRFMVAYQ